MSGAPETATFTAEFQPDPSVLFRARCFARRACGELGVSQSDAELAVLVLNELAANAIMHARTPFRVVLRDKGDVLEISVEDENPREPQLPSASELSSSGRGLALVRTAARSWSVRPTPVGKTVVADLPVHRGTAEPPTASFENAGRGARATARDAPNS